LEAKSPAIKIVAGDMGDSASVFRSLPPAPWAVFAVQPLGKEEVRQGKGLIDAAYEAGVSVFVQTSADRGGDESDKRPTYVGSRRAPSGRSGQC
jgi:hypothetical protein